MEEDLAKEGIELKPKKARSEAQVKAFEKAREIRLENSKLKKEKIAQVKEEVKNRNKVEKPMVSLTSPSLPVDDTPKVKKELKEKKIIQEEESEDEVVVVKRKKKPKVIYMEESESEAEPPPVVIKKKKEVPLEPKVLEPVLVKPTSTIRFC
jgi:hypothetical protein